MRFYWVKQEESYKETTPTDMHERSIDRTHSKFLPDINMLRILWCDNANIIRAKAVHINASNAHASDFYVGISEAMQALPVMCDAPVRETGLSPVGEVHLTADLASFVPLPYAPGHGRAMGDMLKNGKPWSCCPRSFLKKMDAEAHDMNLEVKGAFENEFYLLRTKEGKFEPVDATPFASTCYGSQLRGYRRCHQSAHIAGDNCGAVLS